MPRAPMMVEQTSTHPQVEDKIAAARTRLILDKPFLGALVLRLELRDADPSWCATTGTDAKKFYYNAEYINSLKARELQFVLAHEALHCALSHFARRQHRIKHRWDLACDYAINPILLDEDLSPPPGIMVLEEYRGMSAEEIYPLIADNDASETMDQHLYDKPNQADEGGQDSQSDPLNQQNTKQSPEPQDHQGGQQEQPDQDTNTDQDETGRRQYDSEASQPYNPEAEGPLELPPPELRPEEIEALDEKWQQRLAGAAQQAKQANKLSNFMLRFIDAEMAPKISWRQLLATHLNYSARDDYSYARPNTRRGDPAIYPMLKSQQLNLVVAIDVSGSISDRELNECIAEINAIKGQLRARVTVIAADDKIVPEFPKVFEAWEDIQLGDPIKGKGGTSFIPVFDWMETQDIPADVVVYFSDGQGTFPESIPPYPVIWLIKGKAPVPWGERIQLN